MTLRDFLEDVAAGIALAAFVAAVTMWATYASHLS
jgi:hypothetical protein